MAERRMFTNKITESDAFLDMPLSSQALYFHLCMYADDDGFVKNPKRICRMVGVADDDLKLLIAKSFAYIYESGVIVIKHWRMHNLLRKDRYNETEYLEEKSMLYIKENGSYTFDEKQGKPLMATKWQPSGNQVATQDSIGKDSIDKVNNKYMCAFEDFWSVYPRKKEKAKAYKCYQARLKDGWSPDELLEAATNYAEECKRDKTEEKYTKLGATFLSATTPFADHLKKDKEIKHDYRNDSPELTAEELEELKTLKLGQW